MSDLRRSWEEEETGRAMQLEERLRSHYSVVSYLTQAATLLGACFCPPSPSMHALKRAFVWYYAYLYSLYLLVCDFFTVQVLEHMEAQLKMALRLQVQYFMPRNAQW